MSDKCVSLSSIFYPRAISGAEKAPIVAMYGKLNDKPHIAFVEFDNGSIRRSTVAIIPGYLDEMHYRLRVSQGGAFAALIPPPYEIADILVCENTWSPPHIDLQPLNCYDEVLNSLCIESDIDPGQPLMALWLKDKLQICRVEKKSLVVRREVKRGLSEGGSCEMAISECGSYLCVADMDGVKVCRMSKNSEEVIQRIDYLRSNSTLFLFIEKFNGIYHLFFSEMLGPLRAFRLEGDLFVSLWEKEWDGAHAKSGMKTLHRVNESNEIECIHLVINQIKPTQSMRHCVVDLSGEEIKRVEVTANGAPPTSGLFNNGTMIFYSHKNEQTKSGEILVVVPVL